MTCHICRQTTDFFEDVVQAHCITAVLKFFGMENIDDTPKNHPPPPSTATAAEKEKWLITSAEDIIKTYVTETTEISPDQKCMITDLIYKNITLGAGITATHSHGVWPHCPPKGVGE